MWIFYDFVYKLCINLKNTSICVSFEFLWEIAHKRITQVSNSFCSLLFSWLRILTTLGVGELLSRLRFFYHNQIIIEPYDIVYISEKRKINLSRGVWHGMTHFGHNGLVKIWDSGSGRIMRGASGRMNTLGGV